MTRPLHTRADDEDLLDILARHRAGQSSPQIGTVYGRTSSSVRVLIQRVIADDVKASAPEEDQAEIEAAYAPVKPKRRAPWPRPAHKPQWQRAWGP